MTDLHSWCLSRAGSRVKVSEEFAFEASKLFKTTLEKTLRSVFHQAYALLPGRRSPWATGREDVWLSVPLQPRGARLLRISARRRPFVACFKRD